MTYDPDKLKIIIDSSLVKKSSTDQVTVVITDATKLSKKYKFSIEIIYNNLPPKPIIKEEKKQE
jgi:hypothetical protein